MVQGVKNTDLGKDPRLVKPKRLEMNRKRDRNRELRKPTGASKLPESSRLQHR